MAVDAFSFSQRSMNIFLIQPDLLCLMTGQTDLVAFFLQQQLGQDAVPQMACLAFLFFDDGMHILHGKVFAFKLGMAIQALFSDKLAGPHRRACAGQDADQGHQACGGYCKGNLFGGK